MLLINKELYVKTWLTENWALLELFSNSMDCKIRSLWDLRWILHINEHLRFAVKGMSLEIGGQTCLTLLPVLYYSQSSSNNGKPRTEVSAALNWPVIPRMQWVSPHNIFHFPAIELINLLSISAVLKEVGPF